ncbi:hypothetical protein GCM10009665_10550 [Kitasatospora nipponensis]|uniref:UspA domain-containing protein n=1 Tax=Kitasatospora nipponensis TaxID=258049 RepID=A0ABN1VW15_9ACTN
MAARVDTPVVLVRAGQPTVDPERGGREIVVGVETGQLADSVIDFAFTEAALRGVRLRAVHARTPLSPWPALGWAPPRLEVTEQEEAEQALLSEALVAWRRTYPEVALTAEVRLGSAAQSVLDAGRDADLIVVGRRERGRELGPRLGSVAHAVLHHADSPVAVIPHR